MVRFERRFPVQDWLAEMQRAADHVTGLGRQLLDRHLDASEESSRHAREWRLQERWQRADESLRRLIGSVRSILTAIDECHALLIEKHNDSDSVKRSQVFHDCSDAIEECLPRVEDAVVELRHSALDLLRWAERCREVDSGDLPKAYRQSFAELVAYTPIIRPLIEDLLVRLHRLERGGELDPEVHRLQVLVQRYSAFGESARGFILSVVDPRLELVFHETETFDEDLKSLATEQVSALATEVNDCCQLLLYDPAEFARRVEHVGPELDEDVEASLVILPAGSDLKVAFTVDEDPVFEQIVVTLLHVLPVASDSHASRDVLKSLYQHFSEEHREDTSGG